jgi:hypothetical protein
MRLDVYSYESASLKLLALTGPAVSTEISAKTQIVLPQMLIAVRQTKDSLVDKEQVIDDALAAALASVDEFSTSTQAARDSITDAIGVIERGNSVRSTFLIILFLLPIGGLIVMALAGVLQTTKLFTLNILVQTIVGSANAHVTFL